MTNRDEHRILDEAVGNEGERCVPSWTPFKYLAEHYARYALACARCNGEDVLDVACGTGYGTAALLSAGARSVIGLDIDEQAVEHAKTRYGVNAIVGDCKSLPFEDGCFGMVVSFETIEHVDDAGRFLAELHRVLKDDGLVFLSTPNAVVRSGSNPHHVREWTREEILTDVSDLFEVESEQWQRPYRRVGRTWSRVGGSVVERGLGVVLRRLLGIEQSFRSRPVESIRRFSRMTATISGQQGAICRLRPRDHSEIQPEFFVLLLRKRRVAD